jgi:hypothetical protein
LGLKEGTFLPFHCSYVKKKEKEKEKERKRKKKKLQTLIQQVFQTHTMSTKPKLHLFPWYFKWSTCWVSLHLEKE